MPLNEAFRLKSIRLFDVQYEKAIAFSFGYQVVLLLISGMVLDGGQCAGYMLVSMAGFWASVIVLILRMRWTPSKIDILYIKWGFFPILISLPLIMSFVWKLTQLPQAKKMHVGNQRLSSKAGTTSLSHLFKNCIPDRQFLQIYPQQRVNAALQFVRSARLAQMPDFPVVCRNDYAAVAMGSQRFPQRLP